MTREEAIDLLDNLIGFVEDNHGSDYDEALKIAIKALEQERSRSAEITQYRYDCEKLMEENERLKKALEQEPCEDAISRQELLDQTYLWSKDEFLRVTNPFDYLRKRINSIPSVTPQPKTGHWIDDTRLGYHVSICSNCNWRGHGDTCLIYKPNYCPNCGAKMVESQESEE